MITCSLLAVGDELLDGRVVDTNSEFIAGKLASLGLKVVSRVIVGDDVGEIEAALRMAVDLADVVIVTGGLGPTGDDLTREAVAEAFGLPLRRDAQLEERLASFFSAMGRDMSPTNLKQADLVGEAVPIIARLGTAPGQRLEVQGKLIFLVPGVPREMRDMIERDVIPLLAQRYAIREASRGVTLVVAARPESELAEQIQGALSALNGVGVSYRAMMGQIEVRLSAYDDADLLAEAERRVRDELGPWVVAEGGEPLEGNLGRTLIARGMTLAVAESLTGGMVGERITRVPGSSHYFRGAVVAYTYEAKERLLGVDRRLLDEKGAVNEEVGKAMAAGVRERFSSDIGLALTGIAGPEHGGEAEPPGTVAFGLADGARTYGWKYRLPGDREMVRQFATTVMLTIAYFYVRGEDMSHVR